MALPLIVAQIIRELAPAIIETIAKQPALNDKDAALEASRAAQKIAAKVALSPDLPSAKPKTMLASKSVWYGLLSAVAAPGLMYLSGVDWSEYLGVYGALFANGLIIILLRIVTTKPVQVL